MGASSFINSNNHVHCFLEEKVKLYMIQAYSTQHARRVLTGTYFKTV